MSDGEKKQATIDVAPVNAADKYDFGKIVTSEEHTGRSLYAPCCSWWTLGKIALIPVFLLVGALLLVWFILSLVIGSLFMWMVNPRWMCVFFRDLCGGDMTAEEEKEVDAALLKATVAQFDTSAPPPANPARPHGKTHAIMFGKFSIPQLKPELSVGLFSKPAEYNCVVRSSEGISTTKDSATGGPQGFAVKLCRVPSELGGGNLITSGGYPEWEKTNKIPVNTYDDGTQEFDFLTASPHCSFLVENIREMLWFGTIQSPASSTCDKLRQLFYLPTVRPIYHFLQMTWISYWQQGYRGPFGWIYSGVAPYKFGPDREAKIMFLPDQTHEWHAGCGCCDCCVSDPNILTASVQDYLSKMTKPVTFGLYVQLRPPNGDPRQKDFPIDNAYTVWDQNVCGLQRVATVTIDKQEVYDDQRAALGQRLWYNPWFCTKAHEPLGSLNRARHNLYYTDATKRLNRLNDPAPPRCPFAKSV